MVDTPSPQWGVFRWAWYRARESRARFLVGALVFSLIVAVIVSRLPLPPNPTATQNLIATVLAVIGATIVTVVGSYAWALAAAPFQQRNALRTQLSESQAAITALYAAPVSQAHGDRLRQIAARLRERVEHHEPLDYGADPDTWRRAFHEHFPDLQPAFDRAGAADTAFETLKERLQKEVTAAGMDAVPWTSAAFLPWLATTIQSRAIQRILGSTYNFDWQELGPGTVYIGDPVYADHQVLQGCDPGDVPARKQAFAEFFRRAESWPEAADIRSRWDERGSVERAAIERLAAVANTDPITSRCFLCQGAGHKASPAGNAPGVVADQDLAVFAQGSADPARRCVAALVSSSAAATWRVWAPGVMPSSLSRVSSRLSVRRVARCGQQPHDLLVAVLVEGSVAERGSRAAKARPGSRAWRMPAMVVQASSAWRRAVTA